MSCLTGGWWVSPARRVVLPVIAIARLVGLPHPALGAQTPDVECTVAGTFEGRWNQVKLHCVAADSARPRAAVVIPDALRRCPLLRGDRVTVSFADDNPGRTGSITAARSRGDGGPSSGSWCTTTYPPGLYTGPCVVEERPPPTARADTAGATWIRRSVVTWFRATDDSRRSVSGRCAPVQLEPGVYRIYVREDISRGRRVPGPAYYADRRTVDRVEWETNTYEGGLAIAGRPSPPDSVTDVVPLVRGWASGATAVATTPSVTLAGAFHPVTITTSTITMTGVRLSTRTIVTDRITMTGVRFQPRQVHTTTISMTGVRFHPVAVTTTALSFTGRRFEPVTIRTQPLTMTGVRP